MWIKLPWGISSHPRWCIVGLLLCLSHWSWWGQACWSYYNTWYQNIREVRKFKIKAAPGESVAEDCVNWFDLPRESHCGKKCRHGLEKIFNTTHLFSSQHQWFGWFWIWTFLITMTILDLICFLSFLILYHSGYFNISFSGFPSWGHISA